MNNNIAQYKYLIHVDKKAIIENSISEYDKKQGTKGLLISPKKTRIDVIIVTEMPSKKVIKCSGLEILGPSEVIYIPEASKCPIDGVKVYMATNSDLVIKGIIGD